MFNLRRPRARRERNNGWQQQQQRFEDVNKSFEDNRSQYITQSATQNKPLHLWMPRLLNLMAFWPFSSENGKISKPWLLYTIICAIGFIVLNIMAGFAISDNVAKSNGLSYTEVATYFLYCLYSFHFFTMLLSTLTCRTEIAKYHELVTFISNLADSSPLGQGSVRQRIRRNDKIFTCMGIFFILLFVGSLLTLIFTKDWSSSVDLLMTTGSSLFFVDATSTITSSEKLRLFVLFCFWMLQALGIPSFASFIVSLSRSVASIFRDINAEINSVLSSQQNRVRSEKLFELLCLHTHLSELVDIGSKAFGLGFGLVFGNTVIVNIFVSVFLISNTNRQEYDTFALLIGILINVNLVAFSISYYPSTVTEEAHDCSLPLSSFIMLNDPSDEEDDMINKFLDRIGNEKVAMHVNYFFFIDRKVLLTMYSIFGSYIIILQQLSLTTS